MNEVDFNLPNTDVVFDITAHNLFNPTTLEDSSIPVYKVCQLLIHVQSETILLLYLV